MTTKHVVEDAVLGKVARRCLEIQRRVVEGTLDEKTVLRDLQHVVEGGSVGELEAEEIPLLISSKAEVVTINHMSDLRRIFESSGLRLRDGDDFDEITAGLRHSGGDFSSTKVELRLAEVKQTCKPISTYLCKRVALSLGYRCADLRELLYWYMICPVSANLILRGHSRNVYALGSSGEIVGWNEWRWPHIESSRTGGYMLFILSTDSFGQESSQYLLLSKTLPARSSS